jgi:predicted nucleotidyltransferase component of viral defense system
MTQKLIQERLVSYNCRSQQEEEFALKEITQEIILLALARTDFFRTVAFHGGTSLRIFYGLSRFSEDLDFALQKADPEFSLLSFLNKLEDEFHVYGFEMEVIDRSKVDDVVKKAFLKTDSLGKILDLQHPSFLSQGRKLRFKLEVDVRPPAGATYEQKYSSFPVPFAVTAHDLPTLFAGKIHALLCRSYVKGRDWYDFIWYVVRRYYLNLTFLLSALNQTGPWRNGLSDISYIWVQEQLREKIRAIDWEYAKSDVSRFLLPNEAAGLTVWSEAFFLSQVDAMVVKK